METKKKIKIAIFVPWIKSKGGVERTILRILEDDKYDSQIYTFFYDKNSTFEEFKRYNIIVLRKSNPNGFVMKGASLFNALLRTKIDDLKKYDIFLVSTAGIAEFVVFRNKHKNTIALCHTPLRIAHTMYDYYKNQNLKNRLIIPPATAFYKILEKRAWKRIKYAFVLSDEVRTRLINYRLIQGDKIFNLGPHVDYSKIKKGGKTEKIIFYPSRFIRYKRQDLAIRAFVLSKLPKEGFKLILSGFVEDRKYFNELKKLEGSNIEIRENLSERELNDFYNKSYVTLFLAINEDTGLTPLESLAHGKPVIAVNEGGPKEFIKEGVNGMLVKADENEIANALNRIADKKFYKNLVDGAKKSKKYDEKNFMKNLDFAIERIIHKN